MDFKQAYEALGLPENAEIDEVEKQYDLLLFKIHSRIKGHPDPETKEQLEQINKAYKRIKSAYNDEQIAKIEQERYGNSKRSKTRQKVDHFWEYYKLHVIGGLIGLVLLILVTQTFIEGRREANLPPPDLEIMLFGNYQYADTEALEEEILAMFPEWERVKMILVSVSFDPESGQADMAMQQRAVVMIATERPHLYLVDRASYDWLMPQGGFDPLNSSIQVSDDLFVYGQSFEDSEEHKYGIQAPDHEIWTLLQSNEKPIIAASAHHGLTEEAKDFIEKLAK